MDYAVEVGEILNQQKIAEHGGRMLHKEGTLGMCSEYLSKITLLTSYVPDHHEHLLPNPHFEHNLNYRLNPRDRSHLDHSSSLS